MTVANDANTYLPGVVQIPSSIVITDITRSYPMVVTLEIDPVTESNTYREGQLVRLTVPITYKMFQANGLTGRIISSSADALVLDIDSRLFDTFLVPSGNVVQPATIAPAGSQNLQLDNTSAQVPFQSLNNVGN